MSNIVPKQFKEAQRRSWDSVAVGWQKWWKIFEKDAQNLSNHLVELAKINSSSKVLDIATGIGEPSITAAKKVGRGNGHVLSYRHITTDAIHCKTKSRFTWLTRRDRIQRR
ncbi:MAG TPA: hypothetical protein VE548_12570 [Nitrososphaeraceae archaeon]|jgi:ubiquinone/menaquinone biosynthesis C-methylase UbiE|nr:hypothetical protein [Nitrososphaeraceae archaeon]